MFDLGFIETLFMMFYGVACWELGSWIGRKLREKK